MTPDTEKDSVPVVAWIHPRCAGSWATASLAGPDSGHCEALVKRSDHLAALASLTQRCEAAERLLDEAQTHAYAEGRRDEREDIDSAAAERPLSPP